MKLQIKKVANIEYYLVIFITIRKKKLLVL